MRKIWFGILTGALLLSIVVSGRVIRSADAEETLLAYWKFDEGSGNIAHDSSGNGKDITLASEPNKPTWVSGYSGYALEFDGENDYGTYPALYASSPTSIKFQALIYPHEVNGTFVWAKHRRILHHGQPGEFGACVWYGNVHFAVKLTFGDWYQIDVKAVVNTWHNITAIWIRGDHLWLYLDGVLVAARTIPDYGLVSAGPATIGSYGTSANFFDGIIDEVKVYGNVSPPPLPPASFHTLTTSTSTGQRTDGTATTKPDPGIYWYLPGTDVNVLALEDSVGQYQFDHWELNGPNVGSTNPYLLTMDANKELHAVFVTAPYDVTIAAYCYTEEAAVSVDITMDGAPTGYNTPHMFTGLTETHTFTVPDTDPGGHSFKQWSTGSTSTTITITSAGTYTAYYGTPPQGVGGVVVAIDKLGLLAPYIGLASTILVAIAATAIHVKCVKRRKEK
jgi:hypothetical protein